MRAVPWLAGLMNVPFVALHIVAISEGSVEWWRPYVLVFSSLGWGICWGLGIAARLDESVTVAADGSEAEVVGIER